MTGQCTIQEATEHVEAVIFDLYTRVMKEYIIEIWDWDQKWQENDFRKHFNPENIIVAMEENKAIGYSQVEDQGNQLYIRMLLILTKYQRMGIGTRLLSTAIEKAKVQSKDITLQVFKINERAIKFYKHHEFQVQGETNSSYIMKFMPNKENSIERKKGSF